MPQFLSSSATIVVDIDKQAEEISLLNDVDFEWREPDLRLLEKFQKLFSGVGRRKF